MNNSYITIIKEKRTVLSRKRVPLNQNECTANFRIGVPFEQNLQPEDMLIHIIRDNFDLSPTGIIKMLDLRQPIYKQVSAYGHFGRLDLDLPWERLDKVEDLKKYKNDTEKGTD